MNKNKLALGTAQFGMDYGINNKRGRIPEEDVFEILNESLKFGIDVLDTAYVYGKSETIIGKYIRNYKKNPKIISKLPKCDSNSVTTLFKKSLMRLGVKSLYGYLIHNFPQYQENSEIWKQLVRLKCDGRIKKIGFSLYYPHELDYILENNLEIDIIQVPYNLFDQRFEKYFPILKSNGVEIHTRTVFLQGLVFKNPSELNNHFAKIKDKIATLRSLSIELNIPLVALPLNFVHLNKFIDRVVIGVDSIENLNDAIFSLQYHNDVKNIFAKLSSFKENDETIILPFNWK